MCIICKRIRTIRARHMCGSCYDKNRPNNICSICKKQKGKTNRSLCYNCYKNESDNWICPRCNNKGKKHGNICKKCYEETRVKQYCSGCNLLKRINGNGYCTSCYKEPKKVCNKCGKEIYRSSFGMCGVCRLKEKDNDISYYKRRRNMRNLYQRKRYSNDFVYKIRQDIKNSVNVRLKINRHKNSKFNKNILGYTIDELVIHIESQFNDIYTKEKLLSGEVHIDHRIPCAWFNIKKIGDEEFKLCWALDNLQLKLAKDNIKKGSRYAEPSKKQLQDPNIVKILLRNKYQI